MKTLQLLVLSCSLLALGCGSSDKKADEGELDFSSVNFNPGQWEFTLTSDAEGQSGEFTFTFCLDVPTFNGSTGSGTVETPECEDEFSIENNTVTVSSVCTSNGVTTDTSAVLTYGGDTMNGTVRIEESGEVTNVTYSGRRIGDC